MAKISSLQWADYTVLVLYFVGVLAVGLVSSYKSKKGGVSGYFLASRNMHWIPVGASLFASNIGSGHFIGLAGSGAASGIAISAFELNAVVVLMMLGWLFVPVYMSSGVYTMPEYLRERFGGQRIRVYLSVMALLLYVFTKISADLYAGALFITEAMGQTSDEWLYISVLMLLAIAAIFCIAGGLTAVIWTDFVQTILMIIGAFILMAISFHHVGGYNKLVDEYFNAMPTTLIYDQNNMTCGLPPHYAMHLFRPIDVGPSDVPWPGLIFGLTIGSIWYWCTDQVIVQRTLAAKDLTSAKTGCILAGILKFLPLWLLVFPGMAARVLYPEVIACVDPEECREHCGSPTGCTNVAYIKLVLELLPSGLRGLMLAVMLAALMSSLTSIFNSSSTIFTIDIWQRIRRKAWSKMDPHMIDVEKLVVGRLFVLVLIVVSVIWIPVIQASSNSQLFVYIQSIQAFLSPPICAVYILAIFWDRTNEPGAFWGLIIGFIIGMVRFGLEFSYVIPPCGSDQVDHRPELVKLLVGNIHYTHFGCILFLITLVITISISLLTPPIPEQCLHRLTWKTKYSTKVRISIRSLKTKTDREGKTNIPISQVDNVEHKLKEPAWKVLLFKICGGDSGKKDAITSNVPVDTRTPEQLAKDAVYFLREEPYKKKLVDIAAIVTLSMCAFCWGFFG